MPDTITPDIYTETHPTAAKPHRCCECYRTIPKGEKYQRVKGLWDGEWATYCTCEKCEQQRDDYRSEVGESPSFGDLQEWCSNDDIEFWDKTNNQEE